MITSPRSAAAAAAGSSSSRDTAHYECSFRYLLVGNSGVGKTCINKRFSTDSFTMSYITTIGIDFEVKTVAVGNARVKVRSAPLRYARLSARAQLPSRCRV